MAAIKVIEVFVLPNRLRSFTGLICQVRVLHGRYVFLFLNGVLMHDVPQATTVKCANNFYSSMSTKLEFMEFPGALVFFPPPIVWFEYLVL